MELARIQELFMLINYPFPYFLAEQWQRAAGVLSNIQYYWLTTVPTL